MAGQSSSKSEKMRALLFDSQYDRYRGVISLVSLQSGQIRKGRLDIPYYTPSLTSAGAGDKIASCHSRKKYDVVDVGIMHPEEESTGILQAGKNCPKVKVLCTKLIWQDRSAISVSIIPGLTTALTEMRYPACNMKESSEGA